MKKPKILISLIAILGFTFFVSCSEDDKPEKCPNTYFLDEDNDGFGNRQIPMVGCEQQAGFVSDGSDPDDGDPNITPDCTDKNTYFLDEDADGFGDPNNKVITCAIKPPTGYVTDNTDCNDGDETVFPASEKTYFEDKDGDGFGNPTAPIIVDTCAVPDGIVADNTDCDDGDKNIFPGVILYQDSDEDGYGNPNVSITLDDCSDLGKQYILDNTDCDDSDGSINPGTAEILGDLMDSDCDGIIGILWDGPDVEFNKEAFADWTTTTNQDVLTKNVIFARQDSGPMYNYQFWQDTFLTDAQHIDSEQSDLIAEFFNLGDAALSDFNLIDPSGGTKRVRWALLTQPENQTNQEEIEPLTEQWETFQFYGELGTPENYYSFNNVVNFISTMQNGGTVYGIQDDFTIISDEVGAVTLDSTVSFDQLVGKRLGVWLVDDDIFLTLTFTSYDVDGEGSGGGYGYVRSSPNEN